MTRRIVFYVGSFDLFMRYVSDELTRLLDPRTGLPVFKIERRNGGRTYSIEGGRRFEYLGTGRVGVTRGMRGLSAVAANVVYGREHVATGETMLSIAEHLRYVTAGAPDDARAREAVIDAVMLECGEPYEIVAESAEAFEAMGHELRTVHEEDGGDG